MKHLEKEIIEYISGEMHPSFVEKFETKMQDDPELKAQVSALQGTQNHLNEWTADEIEVPPFENQDVDEGPDVRKGAAVVHLPNWIKYAAAAIILLGISWLSGLQVNRVGNTLAFSFGDPEVMTDIDTKIEGIVAKAVQNQMKDYQSQFTTYQDNIDQSLQNINTGLASLTGQYRLENNRLKSNMQSESNAQYARLEQMIRSIENEQRQDIEGSITALVQYWDQQRSTDLFKIENAFNEVAAAINNQQDRTDAIFSSLTDPVAVTTNY
ncbi:MAG: hypothetical protein KJP00_01440 [Bacteroidia bacterium]|nr:hypothetical protein [Bacteroidia bacterium]